MRQPLDAEAPDPDPGNPGRDQPRQSARVAGRQVAGGDIWPAEPVATPAPGGREPGAGGPHADHVRLRGLGTRRQALAQRRKRHLDASRAIRLSGLPGMGEFALQQILPDGRTALAIRKRGRQLQRSRSAGGSPGRQRDGAARHAGHRGANHPRLPRLPHARRQPAGCSAGPERPADGRRRGDDRDQCGRYRDGGGTVRRGTRRQRRLHPAGAVLASSSSTARARVAWRRPSGGTSITRCSRPTGAASRSISSPSRAATSGFWGWRRARSRAPASTATATTPPGPRTGASSPTSRPSAGADGVTLVLLRKRPGSAGAAGYPAGLPVPVLHGRLAARRQRPRDHGHEPAARPPAHPTPSMPAQEPTPPSCATPAGARSSP